MNSNDMTLSDIARFFLVWLASTLLFYALFSLSGCSQGTKEDTVNDAVAYYVDPETGVNYVEFRSGYALGVCVRVNADGTPYVSEVGRAMAEYIVDTTDGIYNARTTGELVRCRDCKHSATDGEGRYVCMPLRCTTEPGGYCYRGERSEPGMGYRYVSDNEYGKEG